jgi:hypothetical protein
MACIEAAINGAKSLRFPDSAFIVNIDDFPICTQVCVLHTAMNAHAVASTTHNIIACLRPAQQRV